MSLSEATFEWDDGKDVENQAKHGLSFHRAQDALFDPMRVIALDTRHGAQETRFFCFGRVGDGIATVRFTYRAGVVRIFGAGYWRKGKAIYERESQVHR